MVRSADTATAPAKQGRIRAAWSVGWKGVAVVAFGTGAGAIYDTYDRWSNAMKNAMPESAKNFDFWGFASENWSYVRENYPGGLICGTTSIALFVGYKLLGKAYHAYNTRGESKRLDEKEKILRKRQEQLAEIKGTLKSLKQELSDKTKDNNTLSLTEFHGAYQAIAGVHDKFSKYFERNSKANPALGKLGRILTSVANDIKNRAMEALLQLKRVSENLQQCSSQPLNVKRLLHQVNQSFQLDKHTPESVCGIHGDLNKVLKNDEWTTVRNRIEQKLKDSSDLLKNGLSKISSAPQDALADLSNAYRTLGAVKVAHTSTIERSLHNIGNELRSASNSQTGQKFDVVLTNAHTALKEVYDSLDFQQSESKEKLKEAEDYMKTAEGNIEINKNDEAFRGLFYACNIDSVDENNQSNSSPMKSLCSLFADSTDRLR